MATAEFFQIFWHIECSTFIASSFRIWNSSSGIPSPQLTLFVLMLRQAYLTSYSGMSGSRWVSIPSWLSGSLRSLCIVLRVFLPPLLNLFCFCYVLAVSVLYFTHSCMQCSLAFSNFLEEISSLSHSVANYMWRWMRKLDNFNSSDWVFFKIALLFGLKYYTFWNFRPYSKDNIPAIRMNNWFD